MSLLGAEPSEEHKASLRALGNGECIFRDLDGAAASAWNSYPKNYGTGSNEPRKNFRTEGALPWLNSIHMPDKVVTPDKHSLRAP